MGGTARASGHRGNTQRDGSAAQTSRRAAEVAAATELREKECAENTILKNKNGELKRRIDMLTEKLTTASSRAGSGTDSSQKARQNELNEGQRACIGAYVCSLYKHLKFLNNKTLDAYPNVLQKALGQLVLVKTETPENYKISAIKEIRYQLSQKRQYSKKQIMKKYIGT
jgi:uncharacterized FlgJ-related protein